MELLRRGAGLIRFLASLIAVSTVVLGVGSAVAQEKDKPAGNAAGTSIVKAVGTIKNAQNDAITVAVESGGEVTAKIVDSTKILQVAPGDKDLKNATALRAQDLQKGDRVLVRGQNAAGDAHAIVALSILVMRQAEVAAKQQRERDDWQKRGVAGLVTRVEATSGVVTITSAGIAGSRETAVRIGPNTILRRYAPGSVRFDDAKAAPATEIKTGDQLRARGNRSADGSEVSAEEVVSGTFRNIAGTIKSVDAANSTMTIQDAVGKSAVVVKISSDSQMKKLPAEMAQRIAMRLKGGAGAAVGEQSGANGSQEKPAGTGAGAARGMGQPGAESREGRGFAGGNGPPDFQRLLSRLPNSTLADLQKGDAVMIVGTESSGSDAITAITLLAGVEPILTAAPNRSAVSLLSPWSLSTPGGEGEAQ